MLNTIYQKIVFRRSESKIRDVRVETKG